MNPNKNVSKICILCLKQESPQGEVFCSECVQKPLGKRLLAFKKSKHFVSLNSLGYNLHRRRAKETWK